MSLDLTKATFTVDGMETGRRPDDQCRLYVTVECAPGAASTSIHDWDIALGRALTTPAGMVVSEYAANLSAVRADLACARMALESARGEALSAKKESCTLAERVRELKRRPDVWVTPETHRRVVQSLEDANRALDDATRGYDRVTLTIKEMREAIGAGETECVQDAAKRLRARVAELEADHVGDARFNKMREERNAAVKDRDRAWSDVTAARAERDSLRIDFHAFRLRVDDKVWRALNALEGMRIQ